MLTFLIVNKIDTKNNERQHSDTFWLLLYMYCLSSCSRTNPLRQEPVIALGVIAFDGSLDPD